MSQERSGQDNNLVAKARAFATSKAGELILNVFKAGLATAPFCGGIAQLLSDYIPSSRLRRLEAFAGDTAQELSRLQLRVRADYLLTDDFAFILEKCFRGAAENHQREKIQAFRAILVNSAIEGSASSEEQEYFVNLVGRLTALHIRILRVMRHPKPYLKAAGIDGDSIPQGRVGDVLEKACPDLPFTTVRAAYVDLYQMDLVETPNDDLYIGGMTRSNALGFTTKLSLLGTRLVEFCTVPN